jgi:3',5'-cyclic AMP phosphodiesterase CpdA
VRLVAAFPVLVFVRSLLGAGPAHAVEHSYLPPSAPYRYVVRLAPHPAEAFGKGTRDTFDLEWRARRQIPPEIPTPEVAAPAGPLLWPDSQDASWRGPAPAPFGPPLAPGVATPLGDPRRERVAALVVHRPFHVGGELSSLKLLRLRARYRDGLVAYVNGQEVVRRNLEPAPMPDAPAVRAHGPEWETFYVPVRPGLLMPGDNLLTVEARPILLRLMPWLDVELVGTEEAHVVRGPVVQRVGPNRATILFETDLNATSQLRYRVVAKGQEQTGVLEGELARRHEHTLVDLPAHGQVTYTVSSDSESLAEHTFHLAPPPGDIVRFVVYGDVRSGHETHRDLVSAIVAEAPDFVLGTGDLVVRGSDEADWQRYFSVASDLMAVVPVYSALGNHDVGESGEGRRFEDIFALWPGPTDRPPGAVWYSFDVADVHVAVLDSNRYGEQQQLLWLERDLSEARRRGVRAIFAVAHHGPYSLGPHGGEPLGRALYAPVLTRYGVAVLFSGHDHLYQRGEMNGLSYVVTGGGGAALYPPRCGGRGLRGCRERDGALAVQSEHHYVAVEVFPELVTLCPRRADHTLLEPCSTIPLFTSVRDRAAGVPPRPSSRP